MLYRALFRARLHALFRSCSLACLGEQRSTWLSCLMCSSLRSRVSFVTFVYEAQILRRRYEDPKQED